MKEQNKKIERYVATCYLQLEPTTRYDGMIDGFKVAKVTQTMPRVPEGAPLVKLRVEIPKSLIEPYVATMVVNELGEVPTIEAEPITVNKGITNHKSHSRGVESSDERK